MAEVRWSLTASHDLQQIEDFIARDSVLHAVNFVDRLIDRQRNYRNLHRSVGSCRNSDDRTFVKCYSKDTGLSICSKTGAS